MTALETGGEEEEEERGAGGMLRTNSFTYKYGIYNIFIMWS
jgi:hypothetical protein